jgi:hypothetical protein
MKIISKPVKRLTLTMLSTVGVTSVLVLGVPAQAASSGNEFNDVQTEQSDAQALGGNVNQAGETSALAAAEYKRHNDKDSHVPLTAETRALIAEKDAMGKDRRWQINDNGDTFTASVSHYSNSLPGASRQEQLNPYYCGPAAVSMALDTLGIGINQGDAAWLLGTTADGTAWSGVNAQVPNPTGFPVPDVMNYMMGRGWFMPIGLSYNPTSTEKEDYRNRLWVIDSGYPVVGDAWESPGGPHLAGHPINQELFHWYTVYGYYDWGWGTWYMDSASFAANGGWGSIDSDTLTVINGGRGYIY